MDTKQPLGKLSDNDLVVLTQDGEPRAFEVLMERYRQEAYRIAFDFTREREEAKDLSQEAFLRAFANLRRFNNRSTFHTWFYRILVNLCLDYRRVRARMHWESFDERDERDSRESAVSDVSSSPDRGVMAKEISRRLEMALGALPPKQRSAFLLSSHRGLSIRQIAKVMKSAEGAVRVNLHRAVMTLRKSLAKFVSGGFE